MATQIEPPASCVAELTLVCLELWQRIRRLTESQAILAGDEGGAVPDGGGELSCEIKAEIYKLLDDHIELYTRNKIPIGEFEEGN